MAGEEEGTTGVNNVGFTRATISDPMGGFMQLSVWYPAKENHDTVRLGPFEFPGKRNAAVKEGLHGLVMLSHGFGGSDLGHRNVAIALAEAGFIAAAPLHPRDNFMDSENSHAKTVWEGRPKQISAAIDHLLSNEEWVARIDPRQIGMFGFSRGGYTALTLLGAEPDITTFFHHCALHSESDPVCDGADQIPRSDLDQLKRSLATPMPDLTDDRIKAVVIVDPVAVVFSDEALGKIRRKSLLFYFPEHENVLARRFHGGRVVEITNHPQNNNTVRTKTIEGAQHYSFIAPFPAEISGSLGVVASDFGDFDRAGFSGVFAQEVAEFFLYRKEISKLARATSDRPGIDT